MKVGILGGTFDPIHIGHLIMAETAKEELTLDEVWFIPTNVPPHKDNVPSATNQQRWDMVCLAIQDHPFFKPCDIELVKGGTSYSIETIELLLSAHPNTNFFYMIGGDMVQYLPHWHRIDELVKLIRFIGLNRPGTALNMDDLAPNIRQVVTMVSMPQIDISSTMIRDHLRVGKSVRYIIPETVRQYIERAKLYV